MTQTRLTVRGAKRAGQNELVTMNKIFKTGLAGAFVALFVGQAMAWQTLSTEPGRRVEYDPDSVQKEGGKDGAKVTVNSRVLLEIPLEDLRSGTNYQLIEAVTRYDCSAKTLLVVKRTLRKANHDLVREESPTPGRSESTVRGGTVDERLMNVVCRGESQAAGKKTANKPEAGQSAALDKLPAAEKEGMKAKATQAAEAMRAANEATLAHTPSRPVPARVSQRTVMPSKAPQAHAEEKDTHASHAVHAHWAYEGDTGPDNWANLSPENALCRTGTRQSPINIEEGMRLDLEPIRFNYLPGDFSVLDNGHTIQVTQEGNSISLIGKTYRLLQLHFHRPSEERIQGRAYPMVVHLVHQAADGALAVVAVLLDEGAENPVIQKFWSYIPLEQGHTVRAQEVPVDLQQLLPVERGYYTYMGSLTTPPCSEGVLWLVLKQPVTVSTEQISNFSRLYPYNARPVQNSAGRLIKTSR